MWRTGGRRRRRPWIGRDRRAGTSPAVKRGRHRRDAAPLGSFRWVRPELARAGAHASPVYPIFRPPSGGRCAPTELIGGPARSLVMRRLATLPLLLVPLALGGVALSDRADPEPAPRPVPLADVEMRVLDEHAYVPVDPGDGRIRWFLLDTGASAHILDSDLAGELGLEIEWTGTTGGAGAGRIPLGWAEGGSWRLGDLELPVDRVRTLPLDSVIGPTTGIRESGIVGGPLFGDHVVELDFEAGRVRVWPAGTTLPGEPVDLRLENGVPYARGEVELAGETIPVDVLVDLGAKATILFGPGFIAEHDPLARLSPVVDTPFGAGVGGETRFTFARVPRLTVGGATAQDVIGGFAAPGVLPAGRAYDALLGLPFLARWRVAFDYGRGRMLLAPREEPLGPDAFDGSGMFFTAERGDRDRMVVRFVLPGGPAEEAGVRVGDRLVTVDGRAVGEMGVPGLRARLRESVPVRLGVERDKGTVGLVIKLRQVI